MSRHHQGISRRTVLHGLGATIALPCLEIMGGKTWAASKGKSDPARLACFYIPGAINQYNWYPKDTGFEYTISPTHQPLAHHRDRFSVLSKLSHIEGRISGHKHPYNFLTGHNIAITPGVPNQYGVDGPGGCKVYWPDLLAVAIAFLDIGCWCGDFVTECPGS